MRRQRPPLLAIWTTLRRRLKRSGKQFVKFALVGGLGTLINLAVLRLSLLAWELTAQTTPLSVEILASALAFLVAVVSNFLLNRWWTFRSTGPAHLEFGKFLTVSLAGLGLNTVAFSFFRAHLELPVMLSQLLAIGCVLPFNFLLNKFWSFRHA
jgi:putative flippase GtrA